MKFIKSTLTIFILSILLFSCGVKNHQQFPVATSDIKYALGDNMDWADSEYDYSEWNQVDGTIIKLGNSHYFWLKMDLDVPESLQRNGNLYIGLDKITAVCEIYVNGAYIGGRGSFPPDMQLNIEYYHTFCVPQNMIKEDGTISVAIRCYSAQNMAANVSLFLYNKSKAEFESKTHNALVSSMFLIISFISVFVMFYCFFVFFDVRREKAYLFFALSLLAVIIYFLDIATEYIPLYYPVRRGLGRACMPVTVYFLGMFINAFYEHKWQKQLVVSAAFVSLLCIGVFISFIENYVISELLFKLFLLPAVGFILYGIVTAAIGVRRQTPYSWNILIGFCFGGGLSFHDVIYQSLSKNPFMWLQGIGIFILDLSIFTALILRSSRAQEKLIQISKTAEDQHKKLNNVFEHAKQMSMQTVQISNELAKSVQRVMQSARISRDKVGIINQAIHRQSNINSQTADTIKAMTGQFSSMNKEFDRTTQSIHMTANSTKFIMDGIVKVNSGIMTAENFSKSLNSITQTGSDDMKKLFSVIEQIQNSSREILSVASTLDDFAQQTDLLSMNAAIEAAHTGEAGKGFAVIAHEIKKLAANSSSYAIRIGDIIQNVIGYIQDSVKLTEKVNQTFVQIQEGASQSAQKVSAASKEIKEQMEISQSISRDAEKMAASATRMKDTVMKQSAYSSQVLANMEQLTQASVKVDRSSRDISNEAQSLAEQVRALSALADKTHQTAEQLERLMSLV